MKIAIEEIEKLVRELESLPDGAAKNAALVLVQLLMDLHGEALARVLELCGSEPLVRRLAEDELVGSLLLLYGIHPEPVEVRVEAALNRVRPYVHSHGGSVALVGIEDGMVRLHLAGSCDGCPSSAATIKLRIEEAIFEAAPEVQGVVAG